MDRHRRTAIHEAGHYVACEVLGIPVAEKYVAYGGTHGRVQPKVAWIRAVREMEDGAPARWRGLVAAVAGGVAVALFDRGGGHHAPTTPKVT